MANRSAWTAGNGVGFTWTTAINGSDMASLANGSTVLSSVADITNQTALDIYADISVRMTVTSATPPAGAWLGIYLAALLDDGATYGDGFLTSGSTITRAPPWSPIGSIPLETAAARPCSPGSSRGSSYRQAAFALHSTTAQVQRSAAPQAIASSNTAPTTCS